MIKLVVFIDLLKIQAPVFASTQLKTKTFDDSQEGSLELGDDKMDYKTTTMSKHHQR